MTEPPTVPAEPAARRRARGRWQVGLRSLVLLITTLAVWMAATVNRRHIALLEARIKAIEPLAHELVIDDPAKIAVVKTEELWYDDNQWDVYLPAGAYQLCLATRQIDRNGYPTAIKSAPLASGRHRIRLDRSSGGQSHRVAVLCDGREIMAIEEPKEWDVGTGSEGGGQFATSTQHDPSARLELMRRRFFGPRDTKGGATTPPGPTNGTLLWIEPARPR